MELTRAGCITQIILLTLSAIIGEWAVGYSFDLIVGVENHGWHEANFFLRYLIGMFSAPVTIWVAIILFLVSLAVSTPFF